METATIWLTKLILSHLLTDFLLQPRSWIEKRKQKHYASIHLYLHGLLTGLLAWVFIGWSYWPIGIVIFVSHTIIDGWKSYQPDRLTYFLIDQSLHLAVILGCWYAIFLAPDDLLSVWDRLNGNRHFWIIAAAFVFQTMPASILIGQLTKQWRDKIDEENLANAGKWIGIIERIIVLVFVLHNQFAAIGLLVAAKGIIRFNEKERPEIKTEYLVIGTLASIGIAILTGVLTVYLAH